MKILAVHQGYELYGSDRTFIQSIRALRVAFPQAHITVLLQKDGALARAVSNVADSVLIDDFFVLRLADLRTSPLQTARRFLASCLNVRSKTSAFELVYINSIVVLGFIFDAILSRSKGRQKFILHIHEIVVGFPSVLFSLLLRCFPGLLIANSEATLRSFGLAGDRCKVVYNGVKGFDVQRRISRGDGETAQELKVLVIGRINSWKGQDLAIEALSIAAKRSQARIVLRIVGSCFGGQEFYLSALKSLVCELALDGCTEFFDFEEDPSSHYQWCDVVVVPSKRPEPFGLVAIEAMSAGAPVIAADHGGLSEIVIHGATGLKFRPNEASALADCLQQYINDPSMLDMHGVTARGRFEECFREAAYERNIAEATKRWWVCSEDL